MEHIRTSLKPLLLNLRDEILAKEYTDQRSILVDRIDIILEKISDNESPPQSSEEIFES